MTEDRRPIKAAIRKGPRARWVLLGWVAGLASAVISGLVTASLQEHFAQPTFEQRLDETVGRARADGFDVVSYRRVALGDGRDDTVLLVLRPRDRARSDRLEVYTTHGDELQRSLAWQPRPGRARALIFGNTVGGIASFKEPQPYRISVADIARAGLEASSVRVLLEVRGADRYLHYPLILAWDALRRAHTLSPVITGEFKIGPSKPYTRDENDERVVDTDSLSMVKALYRRSTVLRDALRETPTVKTRGANALTFVRENGALYLAAGFVVSTRSISSDEDTDCELELLEHPVESVGCVGVSMSSEQVPAELNMKVWRLDPGDGDGDGDGAATFCSGPRLIVPATRDNDTAALLRNWRRYQRGDRAC